MDLQSIFWSVKILVELFFRSAQLFRDGYQVDQVTIQVLDS